MLKAVFKVGIPCKYKNVVTKIAQLLYHFPPDTPQASKINSDPPILSAMELSPGAEPVMP